MLACRLLCRRCTSVSASSPDASATGNPSSSSSPLSAIGLSDSLGGDLQIASSILARAVGCGTEILLLQAEGARHAKMEVLWPPECPSQQPNYCIGCYNLQATEVSGLRPTVSVSECRIWANGHLRQPESSTLHNQCTRYGTCRTPVLTSESASSS